MKQVLDISTSSIIRVFVILIAIGFLFAIWEIVASIFLAIVIASALESPVRALGKLKIPRLLAALIVYAFVLLVLVSVFYVVFPTLVRETRQLAFDFPASYSQFIQSLEQFFGSTSININVQEQVGSFLNNIQQSISAGASNIFAFTANLFGGLATFGLVLVISFYLVFQKDGVEHFLKAFVPKAHQEYAIDFWKRVEYKLGRWIRGQLLLGIFAGTVMFVVLWLMGVKYALTIAFMIGVLEIIPVIGPITAALISLALVSFQSPMLALGVLAAYIVMEQVKQYLIYPIVIRRAVGLNPIVIIVALLVGIKLIGFWGILLAIPVTVAISEFVKDFRK